MNDKQMLLRIGVDTYRTVIAEDMLLDSNGEPAGGLCLWQEKTIILSTETGTDRWESIWFHEAMHAYLWAFPRPDGEEEIIDWMVTAGRCADHQWRSQGGLLGLLALPRVKSFRDVENAEYRRLIAHAPGVSHG